MNIDLRISPYATAMNISTRAIAERPDKSSLSGDMVYVIKDIFTTRNGSWEPSDEFGSVPQWARDDYLKPWGAPDYFDDGGADRHLFIAVIGIDGELVRQQPVFFWSDGFNMLGDRTYHGYIHRLTKQNSGWINIPMGPSSSYTPERGEAGPWCWAPNGRSEVMVGGGVPARRHISVFAVWQAIPRAEWEGDQRDDDVDEPDEHALAMQQIIHRYRSLLRADEPPPADIVRMYAAQLSPDGVWPDIDYAGPSASGWHAADHLKRIQLMTLGLAARAEDEAVLRQPIEKALAHWCTVRYQATNWWWNQIGVPRVMRDIAMLLGDDLNDEHRQAVIEVIGQSETRGSGANLMWSAELSLHHGCLANNLAQVDTAAKRMWAEIKVNDGTGDGIQRDWSYFQHAARLQTFHYGKAYLDVVSKISWQLRETPWSISPGKRDIISQYILEGVQWMRRGICTVPGTLDRAVSRKGGLRAADLRTILGLWREVDPGRSEGVDAFLASQRDARSSVVGYRHFPMADFTAYHRPAGSIFLKTLSTRTHPTEGINDENKKGMPYLNSGDHYILRDGAEYSGLQPVWKWGQLPGLTVTEGYSTQKRRDFVGGIGNGASGLTAMDYVRVGDGDTISVRKVWVFHEDMIICLLGGWETSAVTGEIFTAVEQCRLRGSIQTGAWDSAMLTLDDVDKTTRRLRFVSFGANASDAASATAHDTRWVLHNRIGYFPLGAPGVGLHLDQAIGSWDAINSKYDNTQVSEPVMRIRLRHGTNHQPGGFAILLDADHDKLDAVTNRAGWEILCNDRDCQGIQFGEALCLAAFYAPGSIQANGGLHVSQPCLAMWSKEKLWLSNPTQQGVKISVTWQGRGYERNLPDGGGIEEIIATG